MDSVISFIAPPGNPKYHEVEEFMTYKLDGAKFPSLDELVEALYPLYSDTMSEEEFRKYAEEKAEKHEP